MIDICAHELTAAELLARRFAAVTPPYHLVVRPFDAAARHRQGDEIIAAGADGAAPKILLSGVVAETRNLRDGRRQILRLRLPGDVLYACEREANVALSRVRVVGARPLLEQLDDVAAPAALQRAWRALGRMDQAQMRDQLVRLGRMTAGERVPHLLLETHRRLACVGLVAGDAFHLPLTQEALGDLLGLSIVHLNRILQSLRRSELIGLQNGRLQLLDRQRLQDLCGWEAAPSDAALPRAGYASRNGRDPIRA